MRQHGTPQTFQIRRIDGSAIDATFSLEGRGRQFELVVESAGGQDRSGARRNPDYVEGLNGLLHRLRGVDSVLTDAVVDSAHTRRLGLGLEARRLIRETLEYPLTLRNVDDISRLRIELCEAQRAVGSQRAGKGGNNTKRVRLFVTTLDEHRREGLEAFLADPLGAKGSSPPAEEGEPGNNTAPFDPSRLRDARKRTSAAILARQGQASFRNKLLHAYGSCCAVTGTDATQALEAAHIIPYWGPHTNDVRNGLLLRADVHTLFDRGLLAIDTSTFVVRLSEWLSESSYQELEGASLRIPSCVDSHPSREALDLHRVASGF